jgi:site-specific recombinase XerD
VHSTGAVLSWKAYAFTSHRAGFAYVCGFVERCTVAGVASIASVNTMHVTTYIEQPGKAHPRPTVKRHLAAVHRLFDYLATGGIIPLNPAAAVRGPKHSVKRGKTPVLAADEARELLDA